LAIRNGRAHKLLFIALRGTPGRIDPAHKGSPYLQGTGNLRAVQVLLGHTKSETAIRYLGVEVEDALTLAEATEVWATLGLATARTDACPDDLTIDDLALEAATDLLSAIAAHADEPHSAAGKRLDNRHSNAILGTMFADLSLAQLQVDATAHRAALLAAAIASPALV
jgi:hypothetical protein